jgi:hypothetical protein
MQPANIEFSKTLYDKIQAIRSNPGLIQGAWGWIDLNNTKSASDYVAAKQNTAIALANAGILPRQNVNTVPSPSYNTFANYMPVPSDSFVPPTPIRTGIPDGGNVQSGTPLTGGKVLPMQQTINVPPISVNQQQMPAEDDGVGLPF